MIEKIKSAGVVGAGGAGFPTHVKLNTKAECLLINAAECEPLIETDKYLCRTYPDLIVSTVVQMAKQLEAKRMVIALKEKYSREIEALGEAIGRQKVPVELFLMRSFYPAGDEQILVQQVTGHCVPERGLPLAVGCVVQNVGTVLSIADALEDKPVTHKFLSVTGAVSRPKMFYVPIGTPIKEILAAADIIPADYRIISGGPMMGKVLEDNGEADNTYVTKTMGNLLILPADHYLIKRSQFSLKLMSRQAMTACIQCRMCTDLCPRYLLGHEVRPDVVMRSVFREPLITDEEAYRRCFGSAVNCCSCGACELFSCPMGLSPRRMNDYFKGRLQEKGIQIQANQSPQARDGVNYHQIPTQRLIARLGLSAYQSHELPDFIKLNPRSLFLPLKQHIGAPAIPLVKPGSQVREQSLIASGASGLSVNLHTGVKGIVTEVTEYGIRINREEG